VIAGRSDLGMPDWRGASTERAMTEQEIADVVAWLTAQRVPFPGKPYPLAAAPDHVQ
jgi:cytochrome c oxidase cbb3-type subunit 3/ubiquinol-cytochrome c reductase cytochrome c subunit